MKLIKSFIFVLLTAAVFSFHSFAADGVIFFSDPSCKAGDTVEVEMSIQADGSAIGDATIALKYPSESLVFAEGTDTSGGAGTLRVHGVSNGSGTGLVKYTLRFRTPYAGSFSVTIDTCEVYDTDGKLINITHKGNSAIKVEADENTSSDSSLSSLEISPGELDPAFSPEINEYSVNVGLSVSRITINALPGNENSKISVSDNDDLKEGSNLVTVTVTAQDGSKTTEYRITVNKSEGGAENETRPSAENETVLPETSLSDGIQLSCKGKTITVTDPAEDIVVPEGFKESLITIDKQKVRGWVWGADTSPEYCVVYGMNDKGELNFYRYDMAEKTIQRYFEDPLAVDCIALSEYEALKAENTELDNRLSKRLLILSIVSIAAFVLLILSIYLLIKIGNAGKNMGQENNFSKHAKTHSHYENKDDEVKLSSRSERRNRYDSTDPADSGAFGETTVIKKAGTDSIEIPDQFEDQYEDQKDDRDEDLFDEFEDLDI